jgi:hypothetical protein
MAYFNHAFRKSYICTGLSLAPGAPSATDPSTSGGFITTVGVNTALLSTPGASVAKPGILGIFKADTYVTAAADSLGCCKIIIAGSSLKTNDMQAMHGGYLESSKSKIINPKYVSKLWEVEAQPGFQSQTLVGAAPVGSPNDTADCQKDFLCNETYYLRLDIKGTAPLRFAHHNIYHTVDAYTGCCDDPATPTNVDAGIVYAKWGQAIADSPYLKDFVMPILLITVGGASQAFYATAEQATADGNAGALLISEYLASPTTWPSDGGNQAGLLLKGAYEDTKFGDCTFQPSDFYGKNPLQIFASEVDLNGDPCEFEGTCVTRYCQGKMADTLGETVLREIIISESYLQNFLSTDLRIREITQGTGMIDIVDRNRLYHKVYLLHSVPRFNNPTGTFDNDQYLVEVAFPSSYVNGVDTADALGADGLKAKNAYRDLLTGWLDTCNNECYDADPATNVNATCDALDYEPAVIPVIP